MRLVLFAAVALATTAMAGGESGNRSAVDLAAPRIIILRGGELEGPRYMVDWHENLDFMLGLTQVSGPVDSAAAAGHPAIRLTMYWDNNRWGAIAEDTARLHRLDPDSWEGGHGVIHLLGERVETWRLVYERLNGQPASSSRLVAERARKILARYGAVSD